MPRISIRMLGSLTLAVSLVAAVRPASAEPAPDPVLTKEVLANGVYLFRASSALDLWTATNVVVIVNDDDVTVFDSNTRPTTAQMVIAEIRKITPKPVRTLINSHWHQDHWSGNDEYVKAFPGIQIIATTETRDYMKRMTSAFFANPIKTSVAIQRTRLDSAVKVGRQIDGSPLEEEMRRRAAADIAETAAFATEVANVRRVLPTIAYRDSLNFWSGRREFRLISVTGDATASTVLYLPAEKILVTGDALVTQEEGGGPPPWTTNSYAITPWMNSLRGLARLDANIVVPGQGPAFHDKTYLELTADLFESVIDQVHAALEHGIVALSDVEAVVNVDAIGRRYSPNASGLDPRFRTLVSSLVRKAHEESLDGVSRP